MISGPRFRIQLCEDYSGLYPQKHSLNFHKNFED